MTTLSASATSSATSSTSTLQRTLQRSALTAALCISLGACAGIGPPVAEMTQAENSISAAEKSGAQEYGTQALSDARVKLAAAQRATQNKENEEALRLATEADVDAKLAQAQADRGKSELSLREIDKGLDTLHTESTQDVRESTQSITR